MVTEGRAQTIRGLVTREPVRWTNRWGRPEISFLSEKEKKAIEAEQIRWPEMDAEVRWLLGMD